MVAVVAGVVALVMVMLLAPSVSPAGITGAVHDVYGSDIEKSAALPEVLAIIASLEPVESLTTEAVTPSPSLLMALERSLSVSPTAPLPVAMVAEWPAAVVIVTEEDGRVAVGLASRSEYHAPVLAKLLTTTTWSPATVPVAAVAVTSLLEDVTVRAARGPVRVLSDARSVVTAAVAVWIAVSAVVWLVSVV
jgi:hypothetical protein